MVINISMLGVVYFATAITKLAVNQYITVLVTFVSTLMYAMVKLRGDAKASSHWQWPATAGYFCILVFVLADFASASVVSLGSSSNIQMFLRWIVDLATYPYLSVVLTLLANVKTIGSRLSAHAFPEENSPSNVSAFVSDGSASSIVATVIIIKGLTLLVLFNAIATVGR